jgi:hypothetical protein
MRLYRVSHRGPCLALSLVAVIAAGLEDVQAQDNQAKGKEEPKLGWSNTSDLSLVVTGGNSESATLGFSDQLRYRWKAARLELKVNVVRANKSDDRFFLVAPGLEFPVGGAPSNPTASLIKPEPELDAANYLVALRSSPCSWPARQGAQGTSVNRGMIHGSGRSTELMNVVARLAWQAR